MLITGKAVICLGTLLCMEVPGGAVWWLWGSPGQGLSAAFLIPKAEQWALSTACSWLWKGGVWSFAGCWQWGRESQGDSELRDRLSPSHM